MFKSKIPPPIEKIETPPDLSKIESQLTHQHTINNCLIAIISDLVNHKREESILKKLDELKNFIHNKK